MARTIRLNINSPNFSGIGKFGIEGTNDEGVAADFYFSATLDGNTVVSETKFADNIADAAAYTDYDFSLEVDSSTGLYASGVYTLNIIAKTVGTSVVLNTYTVQFGFLPYQSTKPSEITLSYELDCEQGFFIVRDDTVHVDTASVTKAWTVTGPVVAGTPEPQVTGSDDYVKQFFNYTNVSYSIYLVTDVGYTLASGGDITVLEAHQLTIDTEYFVDCDNNLAEIKQCVYDELDAIKQKACTLGGIDKLDSADFARWNNLNCSLLGWMVADATQDAVGRQTFIAQIRSLLGCACTEDTGVKPFTLPDGSQQVQTAWVAAGTAFINSFINGPQPLQWRIDRDNRLHLLGEITLPSGLATGSPVQVTSGFISPSSLISNIAAHEEPAWSTAGLPLGSIRLDSTGELYFKPNANYNTVEFLYINCLIPLDAL